MDGIAFNASLHPWSFFVTLTFDSRDENGNPKKVPPFVERRKMLFAYLREAAKGIKRDSQGSRIQSVPFASLLWLAREERGEQGGRFHFHILLDGLPPGRVNVSECHAQKAIWRKLGGGFADVRLYDTRAEGVKYVMKGLEQYSRLNGNAYEMAKFSQEEKDRMLILADACQRKWGAQTTKLRASFAGCSTVITGARSSARREPEAHTRAKETLEEELRRSFGLGMHPAGVSFVR